MKIITQEKFGDAEVMLLNQGERPTTAANQVLIQVRAAGINRPDILQRQGLYPAPSDASPILGLEVAGEIIELGKNVSQWKLGDKVCALVNGGGYAEFSVAPEQQCLHIPNHFSYVEAAALPETFFTVWHNLFQRAKLQAGETLLVHGGTSGIGTAAIQIAIAKGAKVYATAGSLEKCNACEKLGAVAINYHENNFVDLIKTLTDGRGVDVILDMIGGDYIQKNISVAAKDGRIVNIAFLKGSKVELDLMPVMIKRLALTGSTLRAQSAEVKAKIAQELKKEIWPLMDSGKIKPVIDSVFSFDDVVLAHKRMESNLHIGKIVLEI